MVAPLLPVWTMLALAAPAAAAPNETRDYDGPVQVDADAEAVEPTVVAPVGDGEVPTTSTEAPPSTSTPPTTTPPATPEPATTIDPPTADEWVVPKKKKPIPRALATIDGYGYPDTEIATIGKRRVRFSPGVQVRNQVGYVSPFTLDRFANKYDDGGMTTGRIRINPTLAVGKKLKVVGNLDLANGRWAPDGSENQVIQRIIDDGHPPPRSTFRIIDPRELYLEYRASFGLLRVGQQAFTWGQGMLANNGNYVDRFGDMRFGDDGPGDIFERVLFATRPFQYRTGKIKHLAVAIGGDLVFRDERVELTKGDLAGQALIVLRYAPEKTPGDHIGGYAVYRKQKNTDDGDVYPDDNTLEVGVVDMTGQGTKWISDRLQLIGAFEGGVIFGRTDAASDVDGAHKVLQGGAVARGYVGKHDTWLVGLDAGYASGDADPTDRWINNFVFDAGHTVGLVLFNQVNAWRTAQTQMLAEDGTLTGVPLNGTQFLPTRGGVTNALYAHPKFRYALWERLEIWGGPLIAVAPVPIVDPYTTRLDGGVPKNSVNGDGDRRYYGTELDFGIRGRVDIRNFWLMAGLQGGVLLPGPGLANEAGQTDTAVGAVWFRTEIRY
jgi:hypothetical protein